MTVVLKLGGSVITVKNQTETVDEAALEHVVDAIAETDSADLVIVHGGGSFGHPAAARHGVSRSVGTADAVAIREIHAAMGRLNEAVVGRLGERAIPAVPIRPFSAATRATDGSLSFATEPVASLLREGFVPVLHGDVVSHRDHGATILSGDELVTSLARSLQADRVGLCSTVPGILDESGAVIEHIESFESVAEVVQGSEETDVTGGMAGKLQALLELEGPADVFGPDGLSTFLAGGSPGTRVG